jgi:hypothetical protein
VREWAQAGMKLSIERSLTSISGQASSFKAGWDFKPWSVGVFGDDAYGFEGLGVDVSAGHPISVPRCP